MKKYSKEQIINITKRVIAEVKEQRSWSKFDKIPEIKKLIDEWKEMFKENRHPKPGSPFKSQRQRTQELASLSSKINGLIQKKVNESNKIRAK
jgi:hypothetical protein